MTPLLALALLSAPLQDPVPKKTTPIRIALSDISFSGFEPDVKKVVVESLLLELRKLDRSSTISFEEVKQMLDLEAEKQAMGCDDNDSCLAEIAGALGVDVLLVGSVARIEGESVFGLKRIAQREASVAAQVNERLQFAEGEELLAAIGPMVEKLFPELPLRAGRKRGVDPSRVLLLNPPPLKPWMVYAVGATAATAAVSAALFGVGWGASQASYRDLANSSVDTVIDGRTLKERENFTRSIESLMWTSVIITGAALATTGAMVPFTDWNQE